MKLEAILFLACSVRGSFEALNWLSKIRIYGSGAVLARMTESSAEVFSNSSNICTIITLDREAVTRPAREHFHSWKHFDRSIDFWGFCWRTLRSIIKTLHIILASWMNSPMRRRSICWATFSFPFCECLKAFREERAKEPIMMLAVLFFVKLLVDEEKSQ